MQAAIVIMSILGCNDQAMNCVHVQTLEKRWATVALCDVASEKELPKHANIGYPVVVAVCDIPKSFDTAADGHASDGVATLAPMTAPDTAAGPLPVSKPKLGDEAIRIVKNILPNVDTLKTTLSAPVRMVTGTWSWVAKRFE